MNDRPKPKPPVIGPRTKIEFASTTNVERLQQYVDKVIQALGVHSALVSDLSTVSDFMELGATAAARTAFVDALARRLGLPRQTVHGKSLIVVLAQALAFKDKDEYLGGIPRPDQQPKGLCERCQRRPATEWWVGDQRTIDLVRGGSADQWCGLCVIDSKLDHHRKQVREAATAVPKLEAERAAFLAREPAPLPLPTPRPRPAPSADTHALAEAPAWARRGREVPED